ncbi:MAG: AMP-binding protein [Candidatus Competibacteraceae bacterium]
MREDGSLCAPGEPGELVYRGLLVALGYWNDPVKTAERFRPLPAQKSRLAALPNWRSGRVIQRESTDGFLYFIGRKDDMIKTSGYRVPPRLRKCCIAAGRNAEAAAPGIPHQNAGTSHRRGRQTRISAFSAMLNHRLLQAPST